MPTSKTRINISLTDDLRDALSQLSRRDQMPQATKAAQLLEKALELEEDQIWEQIARQRDTKKARFISHTEVWR